MEGLTISEKITSAAIKYNGEIIDGVNHASAIMKLEKIHPDWQKMRKVPLDEGFLTDSGRFVDRQEAAEIADRAGQTDKEGIESRNNHKELDSSELSGGMIH